jgi:hypothetical protein
MAGSDGNRLSEPAARLTTLTSLNVNIETSATLGHPIPQVSRRRNHDKILTFSNKN